MIYADNAATTQISDTAFEKMLPFLRGQYGNASSQYSFGVKAKRAVEQARNQVAAAIHAESHEITFTSGGSESNSWLLRHVAETFANEPIHYITSSIEHDSVRNACRALEQRGVAVTVLPVDATGRVSIADVMTAIKPNTKLVSIMLANNEIGTIQPIAAIGQHLRAKGILFHTDAVQAVGHIPVDVAAMNVDFLTASAHKLYGAKGTGILYKRAGRNMLPMIWGGEQERGLRAGTENVAGIVAMGYAIAESIDGMPAEANRLNQLIKSTVDGIQKRIPTVRINGDYAHRLPGTVNLGFDGVSGESLMHLLDLKGICVSTSSACTSGNGAPSHVLLALGQNERQAKSAIRISYGRYNTTDEVEIIVKGVCDAHDKIVANR